MMSTKGHGQSSGRQTYLDWIGERSHDRGKKLWLNNAISRKSNSQSGEKDLRVQFPTVTAEVKLSVTPERAAVFVDGVFAGHVAEFGGVGRALLVAPRPT